MTDNSIIPVASGNETFANKDVGGVKYPRVLLTWGTGTPVDVSAAQPIPITIPTLPSGTNNIGDVDVLTMPAVALDPASVQKGNGNVTATTLRVSLAENQAQITVAQGGTQGGTWYIEGKPSEDGNLIPVTIDPAQVTAPGPLPKAASVSVTAASDEFDKQTYVADLSSTVAPVIIIPAASGIYHDPYGMMFSNKGSVPTLVTITDGSTVRAMIYCPAGDSRGFMVDCRSALVQAAPNTNWSATCEAATDMRATVFFNAR